jgi:multimeric flavodoxin WrbA
MVKSLGIIGSPRKGGNTEIVVNEALKAARETGSDVEALRLVEKEIKPCDGCGSCSETGKCRIEDDFMDVFEKMAEADAVLIASPSYFESITPQVKALIDRAGTYNVSALGRSAFTGKVGAAISVARRTGLATVWTQILLFILSQRMIVPGIASFPNAVAHEHGDVIEDVEGMRMARDIGRAVAILADKLKTR